MNKLVVNNKLIGKVALVTGASRGIGKGIAEGLVASGATVYITGRKILERKDLPSIHDTAKQLSSSYGGICHAIYCDHLHDEDVDNVFTHILKEQQRMDILANNAFSGVDSFNDMMNPNFWESNPSALWTKLIDVGLRSTYIASCKASQIMVKQRSGLIANTSSMGSIVPMFGTLYSVGKEATDRMSVNMGIALKRHNVAVVSLWPGMVKTEFNIKELESGAKDIKKFWGVAEDPTLIGKAIAHLAIDPQIMRKSAKIHMVADLAHHYGFKDVGDITPTSFRSVRFAVYNVSPLLSKVVPHYFKLPAPILSAIFHKF